MLPHDPEGKNGGVKETCPILSPCTNLKTTKRTRRSSLSEQKNKAWLNLSLNLLVSQSLLVMVPLSKKLLLKCTRQLDTVSSTQLQEDKTNVSKFTKTKDSTTLRATLPMQSKSFSSSSI